MNTTTEQETETTEAPAIATEMPHIEEKTKRAYTKKADMERGNNAILAALNATDGLNKKEILAKLSEDEVALVEKNWTLRISFLEESGQITSKGNKVAKKYTKVI